MKKLAPAGGLRRFDPFRTLSSEERTHYLDAYGDWMEARNGEIDLPNRQLSRREAFLADIAREPVRWQGPVDHDGFLQRLRGTGTPAIDARTLWLLAIAKANEGESYGVDLELRRYLAAGVPHDDRTELYLFLEEQYHSRMLQEACRTCGLDVEFRRPPWTMRMIIHGIYYLPDRLRWPLALCGESLGATIFRLLGENCALFSEELTVAERLRTLVSEIWRDEVLHVAFLRARLGPAGLRLARTLLPLVVRQLMRDVPQLVGLGCDRAELMNRLREGIELPPGLDWVEAPAS
jgi:hypothetical protein